MSLTIRDIVNNPVLHTRLVTNKAGLNQSIHWAHVCELDNPAEWLGEGDLLMTTGIGIPENPIAQQHYIKRLANAHLAGIMIGENMQAPDDISMLINTANKLKFPVLLIAYKVPFSAITQIVLEEKKQQDYLHRTAIIQVYETAKLAIQGIGLKALLTHLQRNIKSPLYLLDPKTARPWAINLSALPAQLVSFFQTVDEQNPLTTPSMQRIQVGKEEWLRMMIPSQSEAMLIVKSSDWLDYFLLSHVTAVIGIELERLRFEFENFLRLGVEVLDDLLIQKTPENHIVERLIPFKLNLKQAVIWKAKIRRPLLNQWNEVLCRNGIRVLFKKQANSVVGLVEDIKAIPIIQTLIGCNIGYSNPIINVSRTPEALREAALALEHCNDKQPITAYEHYPLTLSWLPKTLDEAERLFTDILGTLAQYDSTNNSQLLRSLQVFLESDKSWLIAAEKLNIHKQTLIYRIKKIEEITNKSLNNIDDITVLWFAIKAGQLSSSARFL